MTQPTRLTVVSEDTLFRESLVGLLSEVERFELIDQGAAFSGAVARAKRQGPDLLVVDARSAQDDALALLEAAGRELAGVKVVVVGGGGDGSDAMPFVEAGAAGYVAASASLDELYRALDLAPDGRAACSPPLAYSMFSRLAELSQAHQQSQRLDALTLTPRELEVLELIAEQLSNKTIAARLSLSIYTVKNHVHRILRKLQVERRADAVELAYRRRWLRRRGPLQHVQ